MFGMIPQRDPDRHSASEWAAFLAWARMDDADSRGSSGAPTWSNHVAVRHLLIAYICCSSDCTSGLSVFTSAMSWRRVSPVFRPTS